MRRYTSVTSRTAVYGPVRTVVWQGAAGDCRPYADQVAQGSGFPRAQLALDFRPEWRFPLPILPVEQKMIDFRVSGG